MSIRVTCKNGHKFTVGAEFLRKKRSCPKCGGETSWSFRLRCSQGHSLKIPGKYAGQKGKCPECGELVRAPDVPDAESAETLVSNLLRDDDDNLDAGSSDIIGGGTASDVPGWQSALAELGGKKVASGSTADNATDQNQARSLNDALNAEQEGWKSRRCPHCKLFVDPTRRSCSSCGKYLGEAKPQEIARSQRCNSCGAMSFPGAAACSACGIPLV